MTAIRKCDRSPIGRTNYIIHLAHYIFLMEKLLPVAEIRVSYYPKKSNKIAITSSEDSFKVLIPFFPVDTIHLKEQFVILYLNQSNKVIGVYKLSEGGMTGTVVDIRLILAVALKTTAKGVILCHNHPSGKLEASKHDINMTKKIHLACQVLEIDLLDHLIIGGNKTYLSFRNEGLAGL